MPSGALVEVSGSEVSFKERADLGDRPPPPPPGYHLVAFRLKGGLGETEFRFLSDTLDTRIVKDTGPTETGRSIYLFMSYTDVIRVKLSGVRVRIESSLLFSTYHLNLTTQEGENDYLWV